MLIKRISEDLQIDSNFINNIAKKSSKLYKGFSIPKKNGKKRLIFHPTPELKLLQYWLVNNIFNQLPISDYATAYKKGSSIKKNASLHIKNKYFLHLDIISFFESIREKHIRSLFSSNTFDLGKEDIDLICNICLRYGKMTIGSVSSPILSNCVMYKFDEEVGRLNDCLTYSRYADDMIFSSKEYIDSKYISIISDRLLQDDFCLNRSKTRFMSPKSRRSVTGLVIDNQKVSLGYKKHLEIKKMLYKKLKYNQGNSNEILGHLFYLKDIEPVYFNKLILKYSSFGNIIEILKKDIKMNTSQEAMKEVAATSE